MTFNIDIKPEHDLAVTCPVGKITNEQLLSYYRRRLEDGTLHPGVRELVDGRQIEAFDVDPEGQRRLVELLEEHSDRLEGVRWAFVARRPLGFGMFRMFEAQKGDLPFETGVFQSMASALEWLDVPREAAGDAA